MTRSRRKKQEVEVAQLYVQTSSVKGNQAACNELECSVVDTVSAYFYKTVIVCLDFNLGIVIVCFDSNLSIDIY